MTYQIRYIKSANCYRVKTKGQMTGHAFVRMARDLLKQPKFSPGSPVFFDHRQLDFTQTELRDITRIRDFHKAHEEKIGGGRSAMVLAKGATASWQALWAQGQKIKTANQVRIFEDPNEALAWLSRG